MLFARVLTGVSRGRRRWFLTGFVTARDCSWAKVCAAAGGHLVAGARSRIRREGQSSVQGPLAGPRCHQVVAPSHYESISTS